MSDPNDINIPVRGGDHATDHAKLRALADWFDKEYPDEPRTVQADLRRIADNVWAEQQRLDAAAGSDDLEARLTHLEKKHNEVCETGKKTVDWMQDLATKMAEGIAELGKKVFRLLPRGSGFTNEPEGSNEWGPTEWRPVADELPKEGVTVETKIDKGNGVSNEQQMKREGDSWFFNDKIQVHYTPTHWRFPG